MALQIVWKAKRDFTRSGISVKEGDLIKPYTFEGDELLALFGAGLIVNPELPQRAEKPQPTKTNKPAAKTSAKGATK